MATTRTDFGTFPDTATSVDFGAMTGTRLSPYRVAMSGACIAFNHPPTAPWGVHGGRTRVGPGFWGCDPPPLHVHAPPTRPHGGSHRCGAGGDCGSWGPPVGDIRQAPQTKDVNLLGLLSRYTARHLGLARGLAVEDVPADLGAALEFLAPGRLHVVGVVP